MKKSINKIIIFKDQDMNKNCPGFYLFSSLKFYLQGKIREYPLQIELWIHLLLLNADFQ